MAKVSRARSYHFRRRRPGPARPGSPRPNGRTDNGQSRSRRKVVLVIEDGATFGGLLVALLREEGYQAMRVWHARETSKIARDRRPDLLMVDLSLPYAGEVEPIDTLLQSEELAGKPLIVVTSQPLPGLKDRAGITEIVEKPYDIDKLLNSVRRALGEPEVEVPEKNYDLQDSHLHGW